MLSIKASLVSNACKTVKLIASFHRSTQCEHTITTVTLFCLKEHLVDKGTLASILAPDLNFVTTQSRKAFKAAQLLVAKAASEKWPPEKNGCSLRLLTVTKQVPVPHQDAFPPYSSNAMCEPYFIHFSSQTVLLHHSLWLWTVYQRVLGFWSSYRTAVELLYTAMNVYGICTHCYMDGGHKT